MICPAGRRRYGDSGPRDPLRFPLVRRGDWPVESRGQGGRDVSDLTTELRGAVTSAGIEAMRGNAIIALGNLGDRSATEALAKTLGHEDPRLRAYSAWALGRIGGETARAILESALAAETDSKVTREIGGALAAAGPRCPPSRPLVHSPSADAEITQGANR